MIYLKLLIFLIVAWLFYYIYTFIKINRKEISSLINRLIDLKNPFIIYSLFRFLLRIIRRFFFRI